MPTAPTAPGIVSKASPHTFASTVAELRATVEAKGLTVFAHIDHRAGAISAGLDMQEAQVLIFGAPQSGTPLMLASPLVALDLPLHVLVWQDREGQVWASYQDPAFLAERFHLPDALIPNIAGIAAIVAAVVEQ